ncbi:hypothetical protein U0X36_05740 [Bacillus thuringiensis]|uniref:hypothetical protein n=1 Tax=Bacillus thuringiensis TaxID=1428 RepID=UPI000E54CA46|nr:hypothetical protein [Bacillus thuringiensis]MDZ3952442.1 hypothetical protein [Bacillus thuringiensis]RGP45260.1 hypothetical protein BTW32_26260 [Bacillus thuringiensis]
MEKTDFGHESTDTGGTLFTGDVIRVYVLEKDSKIQIASHIVTIPEKEFQPVKIPEGVYTITSTLNNASVVDLSKPSSQNIALWSYAGE